VLPYDISVYIVRGHAAVFTEKVLESCTVQYRAGADDLVFGKAGYFPGSIGQNVNRVGYHKYDAFPVSLHYFGDYLPENINVALQQIDPGLPRLLPDTGCYDDDVGVLAVIIGSFMDMDLGNEGDAVVQIQYLPRQFLFI
jgi:hypothetical protein